MDDKILSLNEAKYKKSMLHPTSSLKAFVRPILEYAAIAWSPYFVSEIDRIEKVQKFACVPKALGQVCNS